MDAFDGLVPLDEAYASRPLADAFDWTAVASELAPGHDWYLVAFRSTRRADADEDRLTEFDERAHVEAASSPGFVHYFRGPTSSDRTCLSFCLWDGRPQARSAAARPAHQEAVTLISEMYERYTLEFLRVSRPGPEAVLRFEPYDPLPGATPRFDAVA
jgi:hypothetical protein